MLFVGIDPSAGPGRTTACAALSEHGRIISVVSLHTNAEILAWLRGLGPVWGVGVDGPLVLPKGLNRETFGQTSGGGPRSRMNRLRRCEVELARRRIGCFFTTARSFARGWVLRSLDLGATLSECGFRVLEVYPYATKVRLWGRDYPKPKQTRKARIWTYEALRGLALKWNAAALPSHDELDAVLAALTVFLAYQGLVELLGDPEDGHIVIPEAQSNLPYLVSQSWVETGSKRSEG